MWISFSDVVDCFRDFCSMRIVRFEFLERRQKVAFPRNAHGLQG